MTFGVETFDDAVWADSAAAAIAGLIPPSGGSLVITGGSSAAKLYPALVQRDVRLTGVEVFFSDERCVPPDDEHSNYAMAKRLLLDSAGADRVHRIRGEDAPLQAATAYEGEIGPFVERGIDLMLLGMGDDNHIAGCFPMSPAFKEDDKLVLPVDRPDGLKGITLTPGALMSARKVLLIVTGESKAEAVSRALAEDGDAFNHPVRLLAAHPDATFVLDRSATSRL